MQLTNAFLATLLSTLAVSTALPGNLRLVPRDNAVTVEYCNDCVPVGEGGVECTQDPYCHQGAGVSSCSDKTCPFNDDFCSTFGTITTPAGNATWAAASSCSDTAADGTAMGTLTAGSTVYNCGKASGEANQDCELEFACNIVMTCV